MAMFRFLYGLSYKGEEKEWNDEKSLAPHASVYVVAEKYQVPELRDASVDSMLSILLGDGVKGDLSSALRIIFEGTTSTNTEARTLMVKYCVDQLPSLKKDQHFMTLLADVAELGAAMLGHEDLLHGEWAFCCECEGIPRCSNCEIRFEADYVYPIKRSLKMRYCSHCEDFEWPECSGCNKGVEWVERPW